jgi:hypothetical protein
MGAALPGCVIERSIGAVVGAVGVAGGAENVRMPRLPPEKPPPTRACASAETKINAVAIAPSAINQRLRNMTIYLPAYRHLNSGYVMDNLKGVGRPRRCLVTHAMGRYWNSRHHHLIALRLLLDPFPKCP